MQDLRGNPVSTASQDALAHAEHALWQMMSFYGAPFEALDAASAADPAWPLPPLMKAGFLLSLTEPALLADAKAEIERAEALRSRTNPRELEHLAALRTLLAGDWHGACRDWEALLLQHPRDALALQWAHLFDFYRGDALHLQQRVARVLPEWNETDPLHPYVLGQYAFGLEENQRYDEAEATGRRALAGPARVPWAIHAVAHVMEMQGRHAEGSAWMARWAPDWTDGNGFVGHLGWHQALFALERLDHAEALRCFDAHLYAAPEQITLQRLDAAALLWRLHLLGVDVGPRWQQLAAGWNLDERHAGYYAFNDLHALLALIGCGDIAAAEAWVQACLRNAETGAGANREMAREVGAPLMRGVLAYARGRHDDAIAALYPARAQAQRFGGSHAQRDLITQTLLAAAAGATERAVGRALLNERRLAKPSTPLTEYWARRLDLRHTGVA
ncbi:MAG TPA: tetratricopeptide repeat protein [Burkholderiaceae bacterium]